MSSLAAEGGNVCDSRSGIGHRVGIGHREDGRVAAPSGRRCPALDCLRVGTTWLTQVGVKINETGERDQSGAVEFARVSRSLARVDDPSIPDRQVGGLTTERSNVAQYQSRHVALLERSDR